MSEMRLGVNDMSNQLTSTGNSPVSGPPPTTAHKTIGTLNIVFAGLLLLCGLCSGVQMGSQLVLAPFMQNVQQQVAVQAEKERQKKIETLEKQEAAAKTDQEREKIQEKRKALDDQPDPPEFADMFSWANDARIMGYAGVDILSSLVLNVLMLIAGIGLLSSREWARKMGLWVAGIKVLRLVVLYSFAIVVVVPVYAQKMGEMFEKMEKMQAQMQPGRAAPPMPPVAAQIATGYAIAMTGGAVLMIIGGSVYPIISLWVLRRQNVKAACGRSGLGAG